MADDDDETGFPDYGKVKKLLQKQDTERPQPWASIDLPSDTRSSKAKAMAKKRRLDFLDDVFKWAAGADADFDAMVLPTCFLHL